MSTSPNPPVLSGEGKNLKSHSTQHTAHKTKEVAFMAKRHRRRKMR